MSDEENFSEGYDESAMVALEMQEKENARLREENARQQEKIEVMTAIIKSLASDLEEEIYTRFGETGRKCMPDRYEREMQPVLEARKIIGEAE